MAESSILDRALPTSGSGKRSSGWWGMCALIVTEGSLFGYLLFSYFYLASHTEQHWPPEGLPKLGLAGLNTFILLTSSFMVWASERSLRKRSVRSSRWLMMLAIILGLSFVLIQLKEWKSKTYDLSSNLYGSLYFTITGFHMLHVVIGLIILCLILLWNLLGHVNELDFVAAKIGGMYWHFVDVVWLFVFSIIYLLPYLN
jgi:cytochrome c oxidase subunit 3